MTPPVSPDADPNDLRRLQGRREQATAELCHRLSLIAAERADDPHWHMPGVGCVLLDGAVAGA